MSTPNSRQTPFLNPTPIFNRKIDLLYLLYFLIHVLVILLVDITPLYPNAVKPRFLDVIRQYYITAYKDRFFIEPPTWFWVFVWMEAMWHLPVSIWAVQGLWRDSPLVSLNLLPLAVQTAVTTATCLAETMSWSLSFQEKRALWGLYVPYLVLALGMSWDMYFRLKGLIIKGNEKTMDEKRH